MDFGIPVAIFYVHAIVHFSAIAFRPSFKKSTYTKFTVKDSKLGSFRTLKHAETMIPRRVRPPQRIRQEHVYILDEAIATWSSEAAQIAF